MRNAAHLLSFAAGFLSLSQEIVWIRLAGFGHGGSPHVFSTVLTAFLVGIAIGAMVGRWRCRHATDLVGECGRALIVAGVVDAVILLILPFAILPLGPSMVLLACLAATTAALKGVLFPIVHQLGAAQDAGSLGRSISRVYVANVIGATFGPIVTGFFLLQWLSVTNVFALISVATVAIGLVSAFGMRVLQPQARLTTLVAVACVALVLVARPDAVATVAARPGAESVVTPIIENRQGIVHLASASDGGGPITFGGNIYDGRISLDMQRNSNGLDRAYLMAALHASPKRVLVIGMSTGAWTRAIAGMAGIERIDVVEINPAYVELVRRSPLIAPILNDRRIHIHIDDGRRWLRTHPNARYDLIFQNTTFHWRAYTSMLLSRQYFEEIRSHMLPGGIIACNTTGSLDVYLTAGRVFQHAVRYQNFVYMSDATIRRHAQADAALRKVRIDGVAQFTEALFAPGQIGSRLLEEPLQSVEDHIAATATSPEPQVITDYNLLPELRHGAPSPIPWLRAFLPDTPLAHSVP